MSLRKPPTMTPARVEANRRNAQKSTGPRTPRGKAQSCLNGLKHGGRSSLRRGLMSALMSASPGRVLAAPEAFLTPEQSRNPMFTELVQMAREAELMLIAHYREVGAKKGGPQISPSEA